MPIIKSQISPSSATFRENAERMRALGADMAAKAALLQLGGTEEARAPTPLMVSLSNHEGGALTLHPNVAMCSGETACQS